MGHDDGFEVAPGARVRVAGRGPRRPVGPALTRSDLSPPSPMSVAFARAAGGGFEIPVHGADEEPPTWDGYVDIEAHLAALTSLHEGTLRPAQPPRLPASEAGEGLVRRRLRRETSAGIPWWRAGARLQARRRARVLAARELAHRRDALVEDPAASQPDAEAWWQQLRANDPDVVTERLHLAFEDHGLGAAVTAVRHDVAHVLLATEPAEVLVGRWRRPDASAPPVRLPRPERHELHVRVLGSALLAVAADALTVAPGLGAVRCGVVQPETPEGLPAVVLLATLPRSTVLGDRADRVAVDDLAAAAEAGKASLTIAAHGSAGALASLDRDTPTIGRILDALAVV